MSQWAEFAKQFRDLTIRAGGPSKSTSGTLSLLIDSSGKISIEFGAYDIADYPRHHLIGPFQTEEEALTKTAEELKKMEQAVNRELE